LTSKLEVSGQGYFYSSSGGSSWDAAGALFKNSDVNSIATGTGIGLYGSVPVVIPLLAYNNSGTTSSTFQFRAGSGGYTIYFNGSGSRRFGGSFSSFLTIKEYL
jgi:hypothetical protein